MGPLPRWRYDQINEGQTKKVTYGIPEPSSSYNSSISLPCAQSKSTKTSALARCTPPLSEEENHPSVFPAKQIYQNFDEEARTSAWAPWIRKLACNGLSS